MPIFYSLTFLLSNPIGAATPAGRSTPRAARRRAGRALCGLPLAVAALLASPVARATSIGCSPDHLEPSTPRGEETVLALPSNIPSFSVGSTVEGLAPDVRLFDVSAVPPVEVPLRVEANEGGGFFLRPSIAVAGGGGPTDVRSLLVPDHSYQFEYTRVCLRPEKEVRPFKAGLPAPFAKAAGTLKASEPRIKQDYDGDGTGVRRYHYDLLLEPSPEVEPWLDAYEVFVVEDGARPVSPSGHRLRGFTNNLQVASCSDSPEAIGPDGRLRRTLQLVTRPMGLAGLEVATNTIELDFDCLRPAPPPGPQGSSEEEYSNPTPAAAVHEDGCSLAAPGRAGRGVLTLTALAAAAFAAGARRRRAPRRA